MARKDPARGLKWFQDARFGMFIHWGIYSLPGGVWKGRKHPRMSEWIMYSARIPFSEYCLLAPRFNPVAFNAREWVRTARDAGMKYIVITAKHHDGFAMFNTSTSPYNIVDATKFGRDPLRELATECRKAGIRLCFYYSQTLDWQHPDAAGNDWDYPGRRKDFERYLREKARPQVTELLSRYGPIGLIWFDMGGLTPAQSREMRRLIRRHQPHCLINSRIGAGGGDYGSLSDNRIPAGRARGRWETPVTINDNWGYSSFDRNWKSAGYLLNLLADLAGKGVNFLLNVGPTSRGVIPAPSVTRLKRLGAWLRRNGEAIYGASANPYPADFTWGTATSKPGKLFLLVKQWPRNGKLEIAGLRSGIHRARLPGTGNRNIPFREGRDAASGLPILTLVLPSRPPDRYVSVVALDLAERNVRVAGIPLQQPGGTVILPASAAKVRAGRSHGMKVDPGTGVVSGWKRAGGSLFWDFLALKPGRFAVRLLVSTVNWGEKWTGGHRVRIELDQDALETSIRDDMPNRPGLSPNHPEATTRAGVLQVRKPGRHRLIVTALGINGRSLSGLAVAEVRLVPQTGPNGR